MRASRQAGWFVLALAVLLALGAFLPLPPQVLDNHLDEGFARTLHFGAAHGYAPGSELVSTFGPLGFVFYATYFPATFPWLVGLRVSLAAATIWTLAWIGSAAWDSPWGAAVALLACTPVLAPPDTWFILLPLLALFVELPVFRPPPVALRITLGAAIGVACLIKFTALIAALFVLGPLTVVALRARRVPVLACATFLAGALAWLASGHSPADLARYLDWSAREITAGYAGAMRWPGDPNLLLHAAAVSLAALVAIVLFARRHLATGRWAAACSVAAVAFLLFKAGFVRADVHVYTTVLGLLVLGLLLTLAWARGPAGLALGATLVALLPGGLWVHAAYSRGWPTLYFPPVFPAEAAGRLAALSLLWNEADLAAGQAAGEARLREEFPLPRLEGSVDSYSYDQAVVLAHGLDFHPRPVFQSYMAYTPRLARANAEFLAGADAPDWLVFRIATIDHRLPALDDAASWPFFLTHYEVPRRSGVFALLRRREMPRQARLEELGRVESTTGNQIEVPAASGPIWARIDVHESAGDALAGALLAPRPLVLSLGLRKARKAVFRFVREPGRAGFLLSPLVEDTGDFLQFLETPSGKTTNDVEWIKLRYAEDDQPARRAVTVEFFRLELTDAQ